MVPSTFELNYELTSEDMKAWKNYWCANLVLRSRKLSRILTLLAVLLGAVIGLAVSGVFHFVVWAAGLQWDPLLYWVYFFGELGAIVVTVVVFRRKRNTFRSKLLAKLSNTRLSERDELIVGRRTLTASADGFELDSPVGSTSRKWNIVSGFHATDSHVFIVADVTVIVPRNAFSTDTERDEFIRAVDRWSEQRRRENRTLD